MTRPRLADLCCHSGGAAVGYYRAGWEVVGVDTERRPDYPFAFVQADAITFPLEDFDAVHASPPCQAHVQWGNLNAERYGSRPDHPDLESNVLIPGPPPCSHTGEEIAVYGKLDGRRIWTRADGSEVRAARTLEQAGEAMGIDWMTWDGLREAIPPAYTEYVGRHLLASVEVPA